MASKLSSMLKPQERNSVLDSTKANYMETALYACFRVDIFDIIAIKAQLSKAFHIQPSEIDRMPFWELELYLKELEKLVKEENNAQKGEMDKAGVKDAQRMMKPGGMEKMTSSMMPKMPSMGNMNISMPKI